MAEGALRLLAHLTIGRPSMTPADLDTVLAHLAATRRVPSAGGPRTTQLSETET